MEFNFNPSPQSDSLRSSKQLKLQELRHQCAMLASP